MHSNSENVNIVVDLLKKHGIKHIVISPGGTNIPVIRCIQDDDFFHCYSIVDERSAMYFAIGIYLQTKEYVATLCTSAQATRNYIPGLTEAFYKKIPVLCISMEKHPRFKYQEYMQAPDQTSLPADAVKKSYELPYISDIHDVYHSIRVMNEAILELSKDGYGPVQVCIPWLDFPVKENELKIRKIERILSPEKIDLGNRKILLAIGEHTPFSKEEADAINHFCQVTNSVVYVNHLSNFRNEYSLQANLLLSTISDEEFKELVPNLMITIGGQTGDYPFYLRFSANEYAQLEHWRISEDGKIVDTYDKLTKVFQCPIRTFFANISGECEDHSFYSVWHQNVNKRIENVQVPFSNVAIAQHLHDKLPDNSIVQFSILNSLRVWNLFELDASIECYSNVGAFGIDGGMSTLIGQSVVSDNMAFMIIGDLAFFYDMNSLGIRHIKNNLRILLINNNGGIEFKLHGENTKDTDRYIAAANHYKNAKGWAQTCGFDYYAAQTMEEFTARCELLLHASNKPIVLEVFVSDENERDAYHAYLDAHRTKNLGENIKSNLKKSVKKFLGEARYNEIKQQFRG